jgi:Asp-tRNA(Asn)/Glu-tRNA(Gln) amidotransferase A subunit family amidase
MNLLVSLRESWNVEIELIMIVDLPDAVEGAPTGIQLVGRPLKDEECLKMMEVVAKVLSART